MPAIPRRLPIRDLVPEADRALLPRRFESPEDAYAYAEARLAILADDAGGIIHRKLAKKLGDCFESGVLCRSPACTICARLFRASMIVGLLRLLQDERDLLMLTIIPPDQLFREGALQGFDPEKWLNRLRGQLRSMKQDGLLVAGYLDISFEDRPEPKRGWWQPHIHLIVAGCAKKPLKAYMKGLHPRSSEVKRPIKVQRLRNRPKQFSYCFKSLVRRRYKPAPEPSDSIRWGKRSKHQLRPKQAREVYAFLDQFRFEDLRLLIGVRGSSDGLRRI